MTEALAAALRRWRHELHQIPELGMHEHRTSAHLAAELGSMGLRVTRGIGGTGLVATLERPGGATSGREHRAVALRADMDGLPLTEATGLPYRSRHDGVMHACGHDGHMAMLLGAAHLLAAEGGFAGSVHLVFQPAEEHGLGASPAVVSCTQVTTDGARNAIPGNAVLRGDTRSFTPQVQALLERRIREICAGVAAAHGARCQVSYTHEFEPTVNDAAATALAITAARLTVGEERVDADVAPSTASEDFGAFLQQVPGCFVLLGNGEGPGRGGTPLHSPDHDFNDDALETGVAYYLNLVRTVLPDGPPSSPAAAPPSARPRQAGPSRGRG